MMLEDFLDSLGHRVHGVAASLAEARALATQGGFDLGILDCNLGGEPVWPIADMLDDEGVPFLFSSGGSVSDLPPRHAHRTMLEKPYTMATIEVALGRIITA